MAQETTKAVREQYLQTKKLASMDIMNGSADTKYQRQGAKNNAMAKLPDLEGKLLSMILKNSVMVIVTDDVNPGSLLEQVAESNDNVSLLNFKEVDNLLTKKIYSEKKDNYPFNTETISRLNNLLAGEIADTVGATYMPVVQPSANLYGVSTDIKDINRKITMALRSTYGSELNQIYLSKQVQNVTLQKLKNDKIIFLVTEVPLNLVSEVGNMTGRSVVLTTTNLPESIKFEEGMTVNELKTAISKAVANSKKR